MGAVGGGRGGALLRWCLALATVPSRAPLAGPDAPTVIRSALTVACTRGSDRAYYLRMRVLCRFLCVQVWM